MQGLREVDVKTADMSAYRVHLADCVVLDKAGKLYLQHRPAHWRRSPDVVNLFGGHVEPGEEPGQAVIRELHEETGAVVHPDDLAFVGAVSEEATGYTELVHVYAWHDREGTITGCYEAEGIGFDDVAAALAHPKLMDYARWALEICRMRGLL